MEDIETLKAKLATVKEGLAKNASTKAALNDQLKTLNLKINILTKGAPSQVAQTSIQGHAPTVTTS